MSRKRLGTLPVLALMLGTAAALKAASGVDGARAQMPSQLTEPPVGASPSGTRQAAPLVDLGPSLLVNIAERERELALRHENLASREAALANAEARIAEQISALQAAEASLAATMALADRAAEDDIARLVAVFEAMRPEDAAGVIAEMAPDFAAGLVARLRPETAAAILAGIEPRLAYGLSAIIAGRNANTPRR